MAEQKKKLIKKKKEKKTIQNAIVHVKSTFNNTIVSISS